MIYSVYRVGVRPTLTGPVVVYAGPPVNQYYYVPRCRGGWARKEIYHNSAVWLDAQHRLPADEAARVLALVGAPQEATV